MSSPHHSTAPHSHSSLVGGYCSKECWGWAESEEGLVRILIFVYTKDADRFALDAELNKTEPRLSVRYSSAPTLVWILFCLDDLFRRLANLGLRNRFTHQQRVIFCPLFICLHFFGRFFCSSFRLEVSFLPNSPAGTERVSDFIFAGRISKLDAKNRGQEPLRLPLLPTFHWKVRKFRFL